MGTTYTQLISASFQVDTNFEYSYLHYSTKNGLPSNEVYCVFQDSKGYIWFGTDRGLVKYDGYDFNTYTTLDGLKDNVVLAINEDNKGNIWYSCLNNLHLGYITPGLVFDTIPFHSVIKKSIEIKSSKLHFNEIYWDKNKLYLFNNLFGYIVLEENKIIEENLKTNDQILNSNKKIISQYVGKLGQKDCTYISRLGVGSNDYFIDYTYKNKVIHRNYCKSSKETYPTLIIEGENKYIYDGPHCLKFGSDSVSYLKMDHFIRAFQLSKNKYLFSEITQNHNVNSVYYSNTPEFDSDRDILLENVKVTRALLDDRLGLWIATERRGLFYFSGLFTKKSKFKDPIEGILPLNEKLVLNGNNNLKYEYHSKSFTPYSEYLRYDNFKRKNVNLFNSFIVDFNSPKSFPNYQLSGIGGVKTVNDSLYYLYTAGILFKIQNDVVFIDSLFVKNPDLPIVESVYCFKEDSILLGTKNGIFVYDGINMTKYSENKNKRIRHIEFNLKYKILVYSVWGEGLFLEYENGNKIHITGNDGLSSNTINSMYCENNILWLGTSQGINALQFDTQGKFVLDQLPSKHLSSANVLQIYCNDSVLYVGTDEGFNILDLKLEKKQKVLKKDIKLFISNTKINKVDYGVTNHIELSYDSNTLEFNFTALDYAQNGDITYRYQLKGLSDDWVETKERNATFLQLSPGEYKFHLEAQNEYGKWISLKTPSSIIIHSPFWKTWWFIIGLILLVFIIIFSLFYYYTSNLKTQQNLQNELNASRQKALNSQLNPHFVFNSLNSIQNFILKNQTELSSDYLSTFSRLMRYVFENSKQLYVSLADEIKALDLYLELEQVRHGHKFDYIIDSENLETKKYNIPALLVQPIVENAIWHGLLNKKDNDRKLILRFYISNDNLCIEVRDNGVGRMSTSNQKRPKVIDIQKSSGMDLTKQRLFLLEGVSKSKTEFEVIDLKNENNNPCGTIVKLSIPSNL
ncbi:MAG: histidine kinase [Flavobacteriales bacterium]